ncbi:MAG: DNA-deoxyinosine glycosylase [Clostridia bacterium]|nr:DNA-deoxyinosine glycosylase [Clostridia bacterium]
MINHPIEPIYNKESKILILGSFPSVKSRETCFFYGHPQNRFWKVLAAVFGGATPETIEEKKAFLLENKVAVWDVIAACDIEGSADQSIRNVIANDIAPILAESAVEKIYVNGGAAKKLYDRYIYPKVGREARVLPSTSPANAAWSLERLIDVWKNIAED